MYQTIKRWIIICSCLLTCAVGPLRAQTPSDTLRFVGDTLLVESVRSAISSHDAPFSVDVVARSQQSIASDAATSLTALTAQLPGIWVGNRQNDALGERITIRGLGWRAAFGVRGIQIILDGIPLTVADGQSVTNIIDPAFITRTELIRGPAGSFWGNSSGGVLYFSTEKNRRSPPVSLRLQAGSYGEKKGSVIYSQSTTNHDVRAYTSYQFKEGYRDYSQSKLWRTGLHGTYELTENDQLEYSGALLYMPEAQHPSGLTASQAKDDPRQANESFVSAEAGKQVTQSQLGLTYRHNATAGLITVTGYGIYRDLANPLPFGIITVDRRAGGLRGTWETALNDWELNAGAELKFQHDDREEFENEGGDRGMVTLDQTEKVQNEALFLHGRHSINDINISAGLRFDRITFATDSTGGQNTGDRAFYAFSPGMGLSYAAGSSTIYSNVSTSFEAPTTTELVNRPGGGSGFNPNLKPERTVGLEIGSRGSFSKGVFSYDVALYNLWINDLLFPYQLEANGAIYYRNQGETRHSGMELSSTVTPVTHVTVNLAYTLTRAVFKQAQTPDNQSLKGKRVPGIPKHRFYGSVTWAPPPLWLNVGGEFVDSYPVNNLNTAFNEEYFVVDAKISFSTSFRESGVKVTPFLNLNNIFDAGYNGSTVVNAFGGRYFEPAPGRNWQAGITMTF